MSNAIAGFGTLLQIGDGATPTENFTTIAEVRDISGPALALNTVEVTHHGSPGHFAEFVGTTLSGGEVTFTINFLPTHPTHNAATGLLADMLSRTVRNFQLVFPDPGATTWSFSALVTAFTPAEPVQDALTASVTLQITGEPTFA